MGKRPAPSQTNASPDPSPAKKNKTRPTRAAAQRAQHAVHREAQPVDDNEPSEMEVLLRMKAKNRRRATSASTPATTPATTAAKKSNEAAAPRSSKGSKSKESSVGELVVTPPNKNGPRPTKDTVINKFFPPSKTPKPSRADVTTTHAHEKGKKPQSSPAKKGNAVPTSKKNVVCADVEEPSDDEYMQKSADTPREADNKKELNEKAPEDSDVEDSDDDIPDDIDCPSVSGKHVVKTENPTSQTTKADAANRAANLPQDQRDDSNVVVIVDDDEEDTQNTGNDVETEYVEVGANSVLKMITDMTKVLVKQDSRSRLVAREVHYLRGMMEDLLFRVTSLENEVKDVGAKVSAPVQTGKKTRVKKSEGGIAGWEKIMGEKFPDLLLYFPPPSGNMLSFTLHSNTCTRIPISMIVTSTCIPSPDYCWPGRITRTKTYTKNQPVSLRVPSAKFF